MQIESFMWNLLNSDEDIPKDEKLWMKTKLAGKDGEFISNFREMSKSMEEDCASELEEMGIEVPKDFEPERNKLGQSSRSEAFNNEEYELIEDEKEKCMFRRRKKEEYLVLNLKLSFTCLFLLSVYFYLLIRLYCYV